MWPSTLAYRLESFQAGRESNARMASRFNQDALDRLLGVKW